MPLFPCPPSEPPSSLVPSSLRGGASAGVQSGGESSDPGAVLAMDSPRQVAASLRPAMLRACTMPQPRRPQRLLSLKRVRCDIAGGGRGSGRARGEQRARAEAGPPACAPGGSAHPGRGSVARHGRKHPGPLANRQPRPCCYCYCCGCGCSHSEQPCCWTLTGRDRPLVAPAGGGLARAHAGAPAAGANRHQRGWPPPPLRLHVWRQAITDFGDGALSRLGFGETCSCLARPRSAILGQILQWTSHRCCCVRM